jgi:hypothetical protein
MIDFDLIAWDDEDDPRGNVQHIAANGLTIEEVEQVLHDPANRSTVSRSSVRPTGRFRSDGYGQRHPRSLRGPGD